MTDFTVWILLMENPKVVGAGNGGVVRLARNHNNDPLAIKFIQREKVYMREKRVN